MAQKKRRVSTQSDSEDEPPRSTHRKKQRTSNEVVEANVEPVNGIDEEVERQFEREHEEAFMQRVQARADDVKKHKTIGVRFIHHPWRSCGLMCTLGYRCYGDH